jgi:hypothetical protein
MEKVFIQARISPDLRKQLNMYALRHDTSVKSIIENFVQTLVELDIPPDIALTVIREHAEKSGI